MSELLGTAILELRADGSGLDTDMASAEQGASRRMSSLGKGMAVTGAGLTAAITLPLMKFGGMAAEELSSIEQANNQTARSLKRMGADSLVSVEGVQSLAGELQKLSGQDDQLIQMGQNAILTFGAIDTSTRQGAAAFEDASRVMVDFAEATGTSVDAAGKQIAKTMAAASQGVLLLPRGMKLAGEEQARLERVMKSGASAAEKQAAVMEVLGKKVEGAANLTNAEKWDVLQDRLAGVGAQLLTRLLPLGDKLIAFLTSVMTKFEGLSPRMQTAVAVGALLAAAIPPILLGLGGLLMVLPAVGAAIGAISLPIVAIVAGLAALGAAVIYLWRNNEDFRDGVTAIWEQVRALITGVLTQLRATISVWVGWAKAFWREYGDNLKNQAQTAWGAIRTVISGVLTAIRGVIQTVLSALRGDWAGAWDGLELVVSGSWTAIKGIVTGALAFVKLALTNAWTAIKTSAVNAWGDFKDIIGNAIEAVPGIVRGGLGGIAGILADVGASAGAKFASAIRSAINAVLDQIRSFRLPSVKIGKRRIGGGQPFAGLPSFARGGITDGISIAGEAGPEAIVPLGSSSRNRSDRERVLREAGLSGARQSYNGPLIGEVNVYDTNVDVPQFTREVAWHARTVGAY